MATFLTQGVVLRSSDYRDYDRQYILYTRDGGKISAVVQSGKKILSKLNPHLLSPAKIDLMIASGRVRNRVAAARVAEYYSLIQSDLAKLALVCYFFEAVDALTKFDFCDREIFDLTVNFLAELSINISGPSDLLIFNRAIFALLKQLGYQPKLKARNQKQLTIDFHRLISELAEREIKSWPTLSRLPFLAARR